MKGEKSYLSIVYYLLMGDSNNDNDRAVSTVVSFIIAIGVLTIILFSLTTGITSLVGSQQDTATQQELDIVNERVVTYMIEMNIHQSDSNNMEVEPDIPNSISSGIYVIEIEDVDDGMRITTSEPGNGITSSSTIQTDSSVGDVTQTTSSNVVIVLNENNEFQFSDEL